MRPHLQINFLISMSFLVISWLVHTASSSFHLMEICAEPPREDAAPADLSRGSTTPAGFLVGRAPNRLSPTGAAHLSSLVVLLLPLLLLPLLLLLLLLPFVRAVLIFVASRSCILITCFSTSQCFFVRLRRIYLHTTHPHIHTHKYIMHIYV
jgi:hypothetical protein